VINEVVVESGGAAVVIWDLGGAAPLRSIWDKYFAEAHALMCDALLLFLAALRQALTFPRSACGGSAHASPRVKRRPGSRADASRSMAGLQSRPSTPVQP
jgi:hypothetical protein